MADDHEHVFPEEREPSGRLILAPCLTCDLSALDGLQATRNERDRHDRDAQMFHDTANDLLRALLPYLTPAERAAFESEGALPAPVVPDVDAIARVLIEHHRRQVAYIRESDQTLYIRCAGCGIDVPIDEDFQTHQAEQVAALWGERRG